MTDGVTIFNDREYTIEDYMNMDDGNRYELIGGELILVPRPRLRHQEISDELVTNIKIFLRQNPLGKVYSEVEVYLRGEPVTPDIVYISKDRLGITTELNIQGAPDLVIEILSPSTESYDRKRKSKLYFNNGVKEYWIVNADAKLVEVFTAREHGWLLINVFDQEDVLTTALLPGLEIPLQAVFE